jgi:hypothetical protein
MAAAGRARGRRAASGPGREIRLSVAGLRGERLAWVFEVIGEEALA